MFITLSFSFKSCHVFSIAKDFHGLSFLFSETVKACRLNSPLETGKESPKDSNDSNKEKEWLNTSLHDDSGSQIGGNGTCIESEHLFMIKAGTTLSSRYSGVGFVPYKKSMRVESSSKHED